MSFHGSRRGRRAELSGIALTVTLIAASAATFFAIGTGRLARDTQTEARTTTRTLESLAGGDEVLSLSGLGSFEGRCPRGARSWRLRFVVTAGATDTFAYRVGSGARRTMEVNPGQAFAIDLIPYATTTHEPADRFAPPLGQGRGVVRAMAVPTTVPLRAVIYQGTEPQELRADVEIALSAIGGESGQCVLAGSTVRAYVYPN